LYFSAHWCPPCRGFTPALAKFFKAANSDNLEDAIKKVPEEKKEEEKKR
jgi:nucleoredoxin